MRVSANPPITQTSVAMTGTPEGTLGGAPAAGGEVHRLRIERWAFDQAGMNLDARKVCGCEPTSVRLHRNFGDVSLAILSIGMYTPLHARVTCNAVQTSLR
jgi:hypothetical protein